MQKTIITVVGKDTVGIIARVCTYLAKEQINILDISQTMVTDTSACAKDMKKLSEEMKALGEEIGVVIRCQHEDIFQMMHRI